MNFGETLFKLRKEKGLSQEALAERLGTTRQAVSKWENDQGFPETEKLLALSNLFEVSVDTLLKGENAAPAADRGRGWYVSRETARGFLAGERRCARYLGLAFFFWALAGVPWVMLPPGGRAAAPGDGAVRPAGDLRGGGGHVLPEGGLCRPAAGAPAAGPGCAEGAER